MKSFDSYFPREMFDQVKSVIGDDDFLKKLIGFSSTVFHSSVSGFMADLAAESKITAPEGYDRCRLRTMTAIDALYRPSEYLSKDEAIDRLVKKFEKHFYLLCAGLKGYEDKTADEVDAYLDKVYQPLVDQFNKGEFEYFQVNGDDTCSLTENTVSYRIQGWSFQPQVFDLKNRDMVDFLPPEPPSVKVNKIDLETGHLLMADWFRIKAFTEATKEDDYNVPSINSIYGMDLEQRRLAEKFNFFSIHVGNSCPTLHERDGVVFAGRVDEDTDKFGRMNDKYARVGWVCTDLWNVTIIDKAQLIKIIAEKEGDKASEIVEDYIKNNDVVEFHVEPGEYYSYSSGDRHGYGEMMGEYDIDLSDFEDIYFVLSNHELPMKEEQRLTM